MSVNEEFNLKKLYYVFCHWGYFFPFYCGHQLAHWQPIETIMFSRPQCLVWPTKQSHHRPRNNTKNVKYFGQKPVTLDVPGLVFSWQQPEMVYFRPVGLIFESQQHNYIQPHYHLLNFKACCSIRRYRRSISTLSCTSHKKSHFSCLFKGNQHAA